MSFYSEIESAISDATSQVFRIVEHNPVSGGCISAAERLKGDGKSYFLKQNTEDFQRHYEEEIASLEELAATGTIRVPKPLCSGTIQGRSYLVLEYIPPKPPNRHSWSLLGHQFANLHKTVQPHFGWHRDNTIGGTLQKNPVSVEWISFFGEYRLQYQIERARNNGFVLQHANELIDRLPWFFADYTPSPSLLHGDLWSGNVAFTPSGEPFIFDPCCYYGDRETDLAFSEFFGGFHRDFYTGYNEIIPLDTGYIRRKNLYNLYHCLNHFNLFGSPYDSQAQSMTHQLLTFS